MEEIRKHYHETMIEMDREILTMGAHVEEAMRRAMEALMNQDTALAKDVIEADARINDYELKIEDRLTILIATEQPVASELRHIITSLKVISQLERMGDHAVHIAKAVSRIEGRGSLKAQKDLPPMAEYGISMVHEVLTAFAEGDTGKARQVAALDDKIDKLYDKLWKKLLSSMAKDEAVIQQAATLLFVSRYLERFGDHVTNICEWIIFDAEGKHVELNQ